MSEAGVAPSSEVALPDPYWQVRTGHCTFRDVDISALSKSTGISKKAIIPLASGSSILDPYFNASNTRLTSASVLLERLRALAPSAAVNYDFKPTRTENIRLRFLRPDLRESHETQAFQSFVALSYCWRGRKSNETLSAGKRIKSFLSISHSRESQEHPFPISPVIFKAVLDECQSNDEGLWVDQLCIHQNDEEEKKITISAMDAIYKSARMVVVAIEDVEVSEAEEAKLRRYIPVFETGKDIADFDTEIERAFQKLQTKSRSIPSSQRRTAVREMAREYEQSLYRIQPIELQQRMEAGTISPEQAQEIHREFQQDIPQLVESFQALLGMATEDSSALKTFAQKVMRSKWFTRAWCAHEAEMSDRHVFLIKCRSGPRKVLRFTGSFLLNLMGKSQIVPLSADEQKSMNLDGYLLHLLRLHSRALGHGVGDAAAPTWIRSCRFVLTLGAGGDPKEKDPKVKVQKAVRDKLCIVLNTLNTGLCYKGLPLTEEECYRQLITLGLAARDPTALLTKGRHLSLTENQQKLSWMQVPTEQETMQVSRQLPHTNVIPPFPAANIALDQGKDCQWISLDLAFFASQFALSGYEGYATSLLSQDSWWADLASWFIAVSWKTGFDPLNPKTGLPRRPRPSSQSSEILDNPLWRILLETFTGCLSWGIPWTASLDVAGEFPRLQSSLESLKECHATDGDASELLVAFEDVLGFLLGLVITGTPDAKRLQRWTPYFLATYSDDAARHRILCYGPRRSATSGRVEVVIPVCLQPEDYKDFHRVWLLARREEPSEDWEPAWTLLGKVRMTGDVVGFCSERERWQILKNERVYASR